MPIYFAKFTLTHCFNSSFLFLNLNQIKEISFLFIFHEFPEFFAKVYYVAKFENS